MWLKRDNTSSGVFSDITALETAAIKKAFDITCVCTYDQLMDRLLELVSGRPASLVCLPVRLTAVSVARREKNILYIMILYTLMNRAVHIMCVCSYQ